VARAEFTRRAMEGYGTGLADVLAAGRYAGANEYGAERAEQIDQAKANYEARVYEAQAKAAAEAQRMIANFNQQTNIYLANLQDYLSQPMGLRGGEEIVPFSSVLSERRWR